MQLTKVDQSTRPLAHARRHLEAELLGVQRLSLLALLLLRATRVDLYDGSSRGARFELLVWPFRR